MPKHLVVRRTTVWCSALIAFFLLLSGALLLVIASSTAGADPGGSPEATLTTDVTANRTPKTNNGNGNSEHTPGVKSTLTSRTPPRSDNNPPPDQGSVVVPPPPPSTGDTDQPDGITTIPTAELPEFQLPDLTIPDLRIPGIPIPGLPSSSASSTPSSARPSTPGGSMPATTDASDPTVQEADPLSDPPAESDPKPVARNCLAGTGSSGGCAGAGVARDLSPAGLLVLGSVALLGSGAFLESLRGGSRG
jgi:hypothetical protein